MLLVGVSGGLENWLSLDEILEGERLEPEEDEESMESLLYICEGFGFVMCPETKCTLVSFATVG